MRNKREKKTTVLQYIIFALFSVAVIAAGVPKIILAQQPVTMLTGFGYPTIAIQLIGLVWILVGIAVWMKSLRSYAALLATHITAGAIATHIAAGVPIPLAMLVYIILPLAVLVADRFFTKVSPSLEEAATHLSEDAVKEQE